MIFSKKYVITSFLKKVFCKLFSYSTQEYDYYHFSKKNIFEKLSFVSDKQCVKILNKYNKVFTNKAENYLLLKDYYKRDVCILYKDVNNRDKLLRNFVEKHNPFFLKMFEGSGSQGIQMVSADYSDEWMSNFLKNHSENCILEELIEQTDEFAKIHPQSINTLRITTINNNGTIKATHPIMRFGVGDNYCDNRSGISCAVNQQSWKITSAIYNKKESIQSHPDSKKPIIGFFVPELDNAIELAKKMALVFPNNVFTGWDFAHTKNGWILVEANTETRFTVWQLPEQKGFRKELKSICNSYKH